MDTPKVSLLIPAYNPRFFRQTLESALAQTLSSLEICVVDDSPDEAIRAIARDYTDPRLKYQRNPENLGFTGNFTACFELARGEYIKLLNDDDRLEPHCLARQVEVFETWGAGITLVTHKRRIINEHGQHIADVPANFTLSHIPARMPGRELGNFVLVNSINFIGEPSAPLWRKRDLQPFGRDLFEWEGRSYHCLADLSLWLRLLARGDAVYLPEPLSAYRMHPGQEQNKRPVALACYTERVPLLDTARRAGFLAREFDWEQARQRLKALLEQPLSGLVGDERKQMLDAIQQLASPHMNYKVDQ